MCSLPMDLPNKAQLDDFIKKIIGHLGGAGSGKSYYIC